MISSNSDPSSAADSVEMTDSTSPASRALRLSKIAEQKRKTMGVTSSPDPTTTGGRKKPLPVMSASRNAAAKYMDIKCNKNYEVKDEQLKKIMDYNNNPLKNTASTSQPSCPR